MSNLIEPEDFTDVATLGRIIRSRRKRDGLTLVETAGLTNVGVRFLSELENGKPTVRLDKVLKVIAALGLRLQVVPVSRAEQTWDR